MSPGPRPKSTPSGILIHPTVWSARIHQCYAQTDRHRHTDRQHHSGVATTSLAAGPETSGAQDWVSCTSIARLTAPTYLSADIHLASKHRRHLRSSSYRALEFAVPRTRTTFGDRSFAVAGPRMWNSLPATLRHINSYGQFRRHLKTHLFRA